MVQDLREDLATIEEITIHQVVIVTITRTTLIIRTTNRMILETHTCHQGQIDTKKEITIGHRHTGTTEMTCMRQDIGPQAPQGIEITTGISTTARDLRDRPQQITEATEGRMITGKDRIEKTILDHHLGHHLGLRAIGISLIRIGTQDMKAVTIQK